MSAGHDIDRRRGERGREGEERVRSILDGLDHGRTEVKTDDQWRSTGNLYVEYECDYPGRGWRPSRLFVTDADVWGFLLTDDLAIFITTRVLRRAVADIYLNGHGQRTCTNSSHPTRGVALRVPQLLNGIRLGA